MPAIPDDAYWHVDVSRLPVLPKSDTYIDSIGRETSLKADFGAGVYEGCWIGILYTVVDDNRPGGPVWARRRGATPVS